MELHDGQRQGAHVVERRAFSEVLEGQSHADIGQSDDLLGMLAAAGTELERQRGRVEVRSLQDGLDAAQQVRVGELARGDVHVHAQRLHPGEAEMPRAQLTRGGVEHALADGHDEPALLGQRQVFAGSDGAHQGVPPAQERLDRGDRA